VSRRSPETRLDDIISASEAIERHLCAEGVEEGIVFDALRMRLLEIGEAVKDLPTSILTTEPDVDWDDIAKMRDHLAHHYFDTAHSIIFAVARRDVPELVAAARRILLALERADPDPTP